MMYGSRLLFIALFCLPPSLVPAEAQNVNGKKVAQKSTKSQIEELKQQINEIQRQNQIQIQQLQEKIQELEVEREVEIEKIEKVLAEEKDAWYKNFEVGYKKGLFFKSKDGNFKMRMRMRTQVQLSVNDTDDKELGIDNTATDFNIRRFRIKWNGHAFRPWFRYVIQVSADNNGGFELRDAFFDFAYDTRVVPRVGQYKVPFNREELNSSSALLLVERSIVNEEFAYGRDRGAALYGQFGNFVTYGFGLFNGDGRNGRSVDSNLMYAGRIQFDPCCGTLKFSDGSFPSGGDYKITPDFGPRDTPIIELGIGGVAFPGLNIDRKDPDNDIVDRFVELGITQGDVYSITADAEFKYNRFNFEAEYDGRWIDPDRSGVDRVYDQGYRVQGGVFLVPDLVEVAGRWAYIDFDDSEDIFEIAARDTMWQVTPGINFYLSRDHRWKIQLDYSFIKTTFKQLRDLNENIFRAQLQAEF